MLSAVMVSCCSKSLVYAVLSLVSAFLNVKGLFVVLGVEWFFVPGCFSWRSRKMAPSYPTNVVVELF